MNKVQLLRFQRCVRVSTDYEGENGKLAHALVL